MLVLVVSIGTTALLARAQGTYVTIDDPSAGTGPAEGTFPTAIANGWVTGNFTVAARVGFRAHGFLRAPSGVYTRIDPPGSFTTRPYGMNLKTQVVGIYADSSRNEHGFLRNSDGIFITLDAPGASYTSPMAISGNGQVTGYYSDAIGAHGFLWDTVNGFTGFDVGGKTSTGILPVAINGSGVITGYYFDNTNHTRGFVRLRSGKIQTFDASGAPGITQPAAINNAGDVTGFTYHAGVPIVGFVRSADGTLTTFDYLSPAKPGPSGINDAGFIVGSDFSSGSPNVPFERDPSGNITTLSVPHSDLGNKCLGIDQSGRIVGSYVDASGTSHGWLLLP
jgi:hypothetical protein